MLKQPTRRTPLVLLCLAGLSLHAQQPDTRAPQTLQEKTATMKHQPGLLPLDWDAKAGKLYLEVSLAGADGTTSPDYIWVHSLPGGVGQNDLGLDRGQIGGGRIVRFERTGPRVLLVEHNLQFRTASTDPAERAAVADSFPSTVLAGFKVEAESP